MISTPAQGNPLLPGVPWVADNGCFGKGWPGDDAFLRWLTDYPDDDRKRCLFAVAPDVVADAEATLQRSGPWLDVISGLGYPVAFVAQDGLENLTVPWSRFDVLFIGGSTKWKLGPEAAVLSAAAVRRGKHVHMGRVNSYRRLRYAEYIGCSSVDGTYLVFGPDLNLPKLSRWMTHLDQQPALFDQLGWK